MWANLNLKSLQDKFQESLHDLESSLSAVAPPSVPPPPTSSQPSSPSTSRQLPSVSTRQSPARTNSGGGGIGLPLSPTSLSNAQQSASQLADSALSSLRASLRKGRQSFDAARASIDGGVTSPTARRTTSVDSVRSQTDSIKEREMEDRGKGKGKLEELQEKEEGEGEKSNQLVEESVLSALPSASTAPIQAAEEKKVEPTPANQETPEDDEEDEDAWGVGGDEAQDEEEVESAAKVDAPTTDILLDLSTPNLAAPAEPEFPAPVHTLPDPLAVENETTAPLPDLPLVDLSVSNDETFPPAPISPPKPLVHPILADLQKESVEADKDLTADTPRPSTMGIESTELKAEDIKPLEAEEEEEDGWDLPEVEDDQETAAKVQESQVIEESNVREESPEATKEVGEEIEVESEESVADEEEGQEVVPTQQPKKLLDPLSEPFTPTATPPVELVISEETPEVSPSETTTEIEEHPAPPTVDDSNSAPAPPLIDADDAGPSEYPADIEDLTSTSSPAVEIPSNEEEETPHAQLEDPLIPNTPSSDVPKIDPTSLSAHEITEELPNVVDTSILESSPAVDEAPEPLDTTPAAPIDRGIELVEQQVADLPPAPTESVADSEPISNEIDIDALVVEAEQPHVEEPETIPRPEKSILDEGKTVQEPLQMDREAEGSKEEDPEEFEENDPVPEEELEKGTVGGDVEPEILIEPEQTKDQAQAEETQAVEPEEPQETIAEEEVPTTGGAGLGEESTGEKKTSDGVSGQAQEEEKEEGEKETVNNSFEQAQVDDSIIEVENVVEKTLPTHEEDEGLTLEDPVASTTENDSNVPSTTGLPDSPSDSAKAEDLSVDTPELPAKDEPEFAKEDLPSAPLVEESTSVPPSTDDLTSATVPEASTSLSLQQSSEPAGTTLEPVKESSTVEPDQKLETPVRERSVSVSQNPRFVELSGSHEKLKTLKSTLDSLFSDLIPSISSVDDTETLGAELRNLKMKADMGMDEVRRMSGQLDQQKSRIEELRDTHRLEHQSQQSEIDALRDSLAARNASLEEANDKLAAAEKSAEATRQEIVKAAEEYDKLKIVAKEEEEKRVKALSLLRALRQKLVKNEQEKTANDQELEKSRKAEKDALDTLKSDRARFDKEIVALRTAHEAQLTKLRTNFEREAQGLKERFEKEANSKRGQFELDAIHIKATQAKELSAKDARILQLEAAVKDLTKSRDSVFEEAQRKTEEIEATKADEATLRGRTTELEYELNEAKDRIAALAEELEEVKRAKRETNRDDSNARKLLAETEARYESRIRELELRSKQLEKDRRETEEEMGRNMQDRLKEVERMRAALAQKDLDYAESVQNSQKREAKIAEAEKAKGELEKRLVNIEEMLKSVKEDADKAINAEIAVREELGDRVQRAAELEARLEEVQTKESSLRSNNKTLREELRKLQSGVLLSEKQRHPGVGYFSSFNNSSATTVNGNPGTPEAISSSAPAGAGQVISPSASVSSLASAATGGLSGTARANGSADEALNFEYLRNVILQFLEKPEMRPHLISVLGVILHFTPSESRRLIAKAGH